MIETIKLYAYKHPHSILELPNHGWSRHTKIQCACQLNLGFGHKLIWKRGDLIPLSKLIHFYNLLSQTCCSGDMQVHSYPFRNKGVLYIIEWARCADQASVIEITIRQQVWNTDRVIMKRYLYESEISSRRQTFYMSVMHTLFRMTNNEVCVRAGELFAGKTFNMQGAEMPIGQRVQTVVGNGVKTARLGCLINIGYHSIEKVYRYYIMENGKKLEKPYYKRDLKMLK